MAIDDDQDYLRLRAAAEKAESLGDFAGASLEWTTLREHYPDNVEVHVEGIAALRRAGMADEAEHLARVAHSLFPDDIGPLIELVRIASDRGDTGEVLRLCSLVRSLFPDSREGFVLAASALAENGEDEEADALLFDATALLPDDIELLLEHARHAGRFGRSVDAALRWDVIRRTFPTLLEAWTEGSVALADCGLVDAAGAVLQRALSRFTGPDEDLAILSTGIFLNSRIEEWHGTLEYCTMLRSRHPDHPDAYAPALLALRMLERPDEAEELAVVALKECPDDPGVRTEHARLAIHLNAADDIRKRISALREISHEAASSVEVEVSEVALQPLSRQVFPFERSQAV